MTAAGTRFAGLVGVVLLASGAEGFLTDFACAEACLKFFGSGAAECWGCVDKYADVAQLPVTYVKDMLSLKADPNADYVKYWCGTRRTHPDEGVNLNEHPTGWKANGDGTFTGCEVTTDYPGVKTTSYQSNSFVKEALRNHPRKEEAGEVWRGNELGFIIANSMFWPNVNPRAMLLGARPSQHKVIRPVIDEIFGQCDKACEARLSLSALALMGRDEINIQADIKKWVFEELFHQAFPNDANPINPGEFVETQGQLLTMLPISQVLPQFLADLVASGTQDKLKEFYGLVRPLVERRYGARVAGGDCSPSPSCVDQLTSALFDAWLLAGGLSVPSGITTGLWVLYGDGESKANGAAADTFPKDLKLDTANPVPFFYESLRFFPPVVGFPWWTKAPERATDENGNQYEGGERTVLNVALANRDPNAWGADAHKFRVRPLADYHAHFVGFADQAEDPAVAGGAMNRACPGKGLALKMGKAFFENLDQAKWRAKDKLSEFQLVTPFVDDFVLERSTTEKEESFWVKVWERATALPDFLANLFRFDQYTIVFAALNSITVQLWEAKKPEEVPLPTLYKDVPSVPCGLASKIMVPRDTEGQADVEAVQQFTLSSLSRGLPFPDTADECGEWGEGEDEEATIKALLLGGLNSDRVLTKWTDEKYTDDGFSSLMFEGIGQHRVQRVRADDPYKEGATYASYLNAAAGLEVKPGFGKYGADAYFNAQKKVTHIRRGGRTWYPSDEGWEAYVDTTLSRRACTALGGDHSCWLGFFNCECRVPTKAGWRAAKTAFLGTFSAVVSAIDHLYGIHLVVANSIVTASHRELPEHHPLHRLLAPFGYRTAAINWNAAISLTNEFGLLHRATALTADGLRGLYSYAEHEEAGLTWASIPERHARQDVADANLPLHEDGALFYQVVKRFVHAYLTTHYDYAANECVADEAVRRWHDRVNNMAPNKDLPPPEQITCEHLEELLTTFIYLVTAGHTHAGSIGAEFEDPCHLPWAWREGELCAPPRTAHTQMLVLALTSLDQPKLLGDYTHIFSSPAESAIWNDFQADLKQFGKELDARNAIRPRPFRSFDLRYVEISVAI